MDTEVTGFGHTTLRATIHAVNLAVLVQGGRNLQEHGRIVRLFEVLMAHLEGGANTQAEPEEKVWDIPTPPDHGEPPV